MCVIYVLLPGQIPPLPYVRNSTWNNADGYGVVIKDPKKKKLRIIKKCDPNGNDPEEIYKILSDNIKFERIVHVRNRTEGDIDLDNTQPFEVLNEGDTEVHFAHNGTLFEFAPRNTNTYFQEKWMVGHNKPEFKNASDTRRFNEFILKPILGVLKEGDYTSQAARKILDKFWGVSNTNMGILFSNKFPNLYLGDWKEIKVGDLSFKASNDTYFTELKRGKVFEEEKRKKQEERRFQPSPDGQKTEVFQVSSSVFQERYQLSDNFLKNLDKDWSLYTPEGQAALSNLTYIEVQKLSEILPKIELPIFIFMLVNFLNELTKENEALKANIKEITGVEEDDPNAV